MLELTADNVASYLQQEGRLTPRPIDVQPLGGGVSNAVFCVQAGNQRLILKQSRPQLRTHDVWLSDLDRVYREQEVMEALHPLLPSDVVPRVLWSDRANYVFAMSHAPAPFRVWKELLLDGEADTEHAALAGRILGRIHEVTTAPAMVEQFADRRAFVQLRVDPFYRRVQERRPEIAAAVTPLIDQLLSLCEALCHGDFSPKNLLAHASGFTLVDYETAHIGDPTMDLGFFLSHLVLKSLHHCDARGRFFELTRAFWRGYAAEVRFRCVAELARRGIGHFGVCVLARVDGTSPVDYLQQEPKREAVRRLARRVLLERPIEWEDVLRLCEAEWARVA